jgi:hypothetical protein
MDVVEYTGGFPFEFWIFGYFVFDLALFNKKKIDEFLFLNYVIIMRTNPTTSCPGVSTIEEKSVGRIDQIIGPMLDITFPPGKLPYVYNDLIVKKQVPLAHISDSIHNLEVYCCLRIWWLSSICLHARLTQ